MAPGKSILRLNLGPNDTVAQRQMGKRRNDLYSQSPKKPLSNLQLLNPENRTLESWPLNHGLRPANSMPHPSPRTQSKRKYRKTDGILPEPLVSTESASILEMKVGRIVRGYLMPLMISFAKDRFDDSEPPVVSIWFHY